MHKLSYLAAAQAAVFPLMACVPASRLESQRARTATCEQQSAARAKRIEELEKDLTQVRRAYRDRLSAATGELQRLRAERAAQAQAAQAEVERLRALAGRLRKRFRRMIDAGTLRIDIVHGRLVLKLRSAVLFDSGKDVLRKGGRAALSEIAPELRAMQDRHFQVAGHTDDQPIRYSRFRSNWALSSARAVRVVRYLESRGVTATSLSAGGFSQYQPVASNQDEAGRQQNRRIEITLLPRLDRKTVPH